MQLHLPRPPSAQTTLALVALVPVVALLAYAGLAHVPSLHEKITEAVNAKKIHFEYAGALKDTAQPLVKGTRFEGRINTTDSPITNSLNLYVVEPQAVGMLALACNCGYVGAGIVLCDKAFLDSFSSSINYETTDPKLRQDLVKVEALHNRWLASWLIGHEIGHAVLHDRVGQYSKQLARGRSATMQQEEEADAYFADHIPISERDRAVFVLTDFSFQAFSLTYAQQAVSGTGTAIIRPSVDGIHPPWLLRALRVARVVSELKEGPRSGEDFYGGLAQRVRVDKSGSDVGSLCSAENLRSQAAAQYRPLPTK